MSYSTTSTPKLCGCGCGQPTPIAKRNRPEIGHAKGQPTRFVAGHTPPGTNKGRKPKIRPLVDRFWEKVDKRGPNECWLWLGSIDVRGYGVIRNNNRPVGAHCISYELNHGPIPKGITPILIIGTLQVWAWMLLSTQFAKVSFTPVAQVDRRTNVYFAVGGIPDQIDSTNAI